MNEHPDPGGEATARAAQLAAMTLSVAEAIARLRAQRINDRVDEQRRFDAALRATERSQSARDAIQYRAALSPTWLREQDTRVLLNTWHAAGSPPRRRPTRPAGGHPDRGAAPPAPPRGDGDVRRGQ